MQEKPEDPSTCSRSLLPVFTKWRNQRHIAARKFWEEGSRVFKAADAFHMVAVEEKDCTISS